MSGMRDLARNLGELQGLPSRITRDVADGINDAIQEEFSQGRDPYGKPWAPLRPSTVLRKRGDRRILRETDELSTETVAKPMSGAGVEIVSIERGKYHQTGTTNMVARKILPEGSSIPESWTHAIEDATEKAIVKAMRGRG